MRHHLQLLLLAVIGILLTACQSIQVQRDFDPNRDFSAYQSWGWKEPALIYMPADPRLRSDLTEQRIRETTDQQLLQRGMRPAAAGATPDLLVQAALILENHQNQIYTNYGGYWSGYWGPYWGGPGFSEVRTVNYKVVTLQIDLYDSRDGRLVWRGSADQIFDEGSTTPEKRTAIINETVSRILSKYPPYH